MRNGPENRRILSVSQLARSARVLLEERFGLVWVEGEISNFRRPGSGHWYFTLKDDGAQLKCAMFAGRNRFLKVVPRDGARVVVRGRLSLYEPRGDFQMIADHMELSGEGELRAAFEALKIKLATEGLFAEERKAELPVYPRHVAVITSRSGAALRDVISVLRRRCPLLEVTVLPIVVQGIEAERDILTALARLRDWPSDIGRDAPDVAILARGGGSLEDLWSFNLESVARAIAACPVPIVSAIGHETDFTIADFVADLRAPTPSAAGELVAPDLSARLVHLIRLERTLRAHMGRVLADVRRHVQLFARRLVSPARTLQMQMQRVDDLERALGASATRLIGRHAATLEHVRARLAHQHPRREIERRGQLIEQSSTRLARAAERLLERSRARLEPVTRALNAVSPLQTLDRGYAVLTTPPPTGARWGVPVTHTGQANAGDKLVAHLKNGRLNVTVDDIDAD